MFWPDVTRLKQFYGSLTGQVACQALRRRIRQFWPAMEGESLLGIGYAPPYLLPYLEQADPAMACMPAEQGVAHWPAASRNLSFLADEGALPLADNMINRVLLAHALENSDQARRMLEEAWRVLAPTGRILVIAPNRSGMWARASSSPFAHGRPYSASQLRQLLADARFAPLETRAALFFPPTKWKFLLRAARLMEEAGCRLFPGFGGVILIEAEKQIYAPARGTPAAASARPAYAPAAKPAMGFKRVICSFRRARQ